MEAVNPLTRGLNLDLQISRAALQASSAFCRCKPHIYSSPYRLTKPQFPSLVSPAPGRSSTELCVQAAPRGVSHTTESVSPTDCRVFSTAWTSAVGPGRFAVHTDGLRLRCVNAIGRRGSSPVSTVWPSGDGWGNRVGVGWYKPISEHVGRFGVFVRAVDSGLAAEEWSYFVCSIY